MPMEKKDVCLTLENVSKVFARVESDEVTHALQDVSVTMKSGEFVSLVGPSGCGKSDDPPHCGGAHPADTRPCRRKQGGDRSPRAERGLVFQNPTLFPWLTVEKNISFSLDMRGAKSGKAERVERMLSMIGLERFRNDYPAQLSGGMAQRVALVRTLINEPRYCAREPLGALDEFTRMNMQDEILNLWSQRKQLALMVTHSIDEAVYMGTRVLVMESNPGRIVADIRIDEDFPRDRSSANFVEYRNEILNRLHFGGKKTE